MSSNRSNTTVTFRKNDVEIYQPAPISYKFARFCSNNIGRRTTELKRWNSRNRYITITPISTRFCTWASPIHVKIVFVQRESERQFATDLTMPDSVYRNRAFKSLHTRIPSLTAPIKPASTCDQFVRDQSVDDIMESFVYRSIQR